MSTYREMVYMCLDLLKLSSDDSYYNEDHILFLLDKYRAFVLKSTYKDIRKELPESNYQYLTLHLEVSEGIEGVPAAGHYLKSREAIPDTMSIAVPRVSTENFLKGEFTFVSKERMKYVGRNKWLTNFIYCTLGPDNKLYLKSRNPQMFYLESLLFGAVFENPSAVDGEDDIMDSNFPLEEALIPQVIDYVVKELSQSIYKPEDEVNNASDDLAKVGVATAAASKKQ